MYKIIIDANVWIKYARAKGIAPLLNRLVAYNLLPVVNNYLLSEIFDALLENNWMKEKKAGLVIEFIKKISLPVTENAVYRISPDTKDNYFKADTCSYFPMVSQDLSDRSEITNTIHLVTSDAVDR